MSGRWGTGWQYWTVMAFRADGALRNGLSLTVLRNQKTTSLCFISGMIFEVMLIIGRTMVSLRVIRVRRRRVEDIRVIYAFFWITPIFVRLEDNKCPAANIIVFYSSGFPPICLRDQ